MTMIKNKFLSGLLLTGLFFGVNVSKAQKVAVPINSYGVWDRGEGIDDYSDPTADFVLGMEVSARWAEVQSKGPENMIFLFFSRP